jgi:hypothetical protein
MMITSDWKLLHRQNTSPIDLGIWKKKITAAPCLLNQRSGRIEIKFIDRARYPRSVVFFSVSSNCLDHLSCCECIYRIHSSFPWNASPSINLRTGFLLRGRVVTPHVNLAQTIFINQGLIKWLTPSWANQA